MRSIENSIEKVERVELVREARFRVRVDSDSTLEALKQLVSAVSYSSDPITVVLKRATVYGARARARALNLAKV